MTADRPDNALHPDDAAALAADWDQRFPESAPHVIDGQSAPPAAVAAPGVQEGAPE